MYLYTVHTVFPRILSARSINFTVCVMRGQFEGALYLRARFNSTDHAAKPRHIVKLDRRIFLVYCSQANKGYLRMVVLAAHWLKILESLKALCIS